MGVPVLVLGESGTGKSASLRNFKAEELKVINVANKPLPFKNKFESISSDDYRTVIKELKTSDKKVIVIDDAQYLMANEFMRRATERGFDKFTEIAQNFWNLVNAVKDLPGDTIVYFLAHIERDANGNEKIKTIGKLLDEKITVEGMFTIVLKTNVTDGVYSFLTQNSGHDTVKSPIGMFSAYAIDNDLKFVDEKIRNYYELGEFLTDEELAEIEENVKHGDIPIKEEPKKRGRRSAKKEESSETPSEEKTEEKPKRSRKKAEENMDNDSDNQQSEPTVSEGATDGKSTRSRRKVSEELKEEREEVKAKNEEIIADANTSESGEPIPFEEAKEPETEPLPKRKSRKKSDDQVQADSEPKAADESNEPSEKPKRSRTRRTSKDEPTETVEPSGTETASEAPTRRRRRRA